MAENDTILALARRIALESVAVKEARPNITVRATFNDTVAKISLHKNDDGSVRIHLVKSMPTKWKHYLHFDLTEEGAAVNEKVHQIVRKIIVPHLVPEGQQCLAEVYIEDEKMYTSPSSILDAIYVGMDLVSVSEFVPSDQ